MLTRGEAVPVQGVIEPGHDRGGLREAREGDDLTAGDRLLGERPETLGQERHGDVVALDEFERPGPVGEQYGRARRPERRSGTREEGSGELLGGRGEAECARRVLQHADPGLGCLRIPSGEQQLALVVLALGGVEHRRADRAGPAIGIRHHRCIDEDGELALVGASHGERDLPHLAGEAQHHRVTGLVEELPRRGEEVDEGGAEQRLPVMAGPSFERAVDAGDRAVGGGLEVTAGCVLEQLDVLRRRCRPVRRPSGHGRCAPGRWARRRRSSRQERPDLAHQFVGCRQVGAVTGRGQLHEPAHRDLLVHVLARRTSGRSRRPSTAARASACARR